ncbi:zinc ABC transporter substrate-binding protein [Alkalimarinus coralli]|uniref:zinc ABC transporter substrate-binding protein n=1 Tax=Alkalimarinus coralli TaxID=2935863 RepID=UPI00202B6922|nr:zinc ABC transporter substrate-binding protein [Alkalimarinus coralli]
MRKKILACTLFSLGFPLNVLAEAPKVAVDIAPLHSLVGQVMEGVGQPELIIPPEASPHYYSLRPSQADALANSKIVFWIGEPLTPWLDKAMNNVASSAQKVSMLDLESTTTHEFREGATFEEHVHHEKDEHQDDHDDHNPGLIDQFLSLFSSHDQEEDHQDGHNEHHDDHKGVDPHAWLDPENAKSWINEIKKALSAQDPKNAMTYDANAQKAIAQLDRLIVQTRSSVDNLGELKFIVFHDAYQYFERRFGVEAVGSISLGDAEDPSPARITEIRDTVKKLGVNCVFAEPQYDPGLVENVFEGSSIIAIGVMDPLGASIKTGNQHYPELIKGMVTSLAECNK